MTELSNIWDKALSWMIPSSFTGVVFLIGFIFTTNIRISNVELENLELKKRVKELENTKFQPSDFNSGIEPIRIEIRYMSDDIREIKEILKKNK